MKGTEQFTKTIKEYLDERAKADELFAEKYANKEKKLEDCITYILNTVKQTGCNGFSDEEIYGMAVHYYDEDSVDVGKKIRCRVSVNHIVEITDEEKKEAREKVIQELVEKEREKMIKKKAKKNITQSAQQASLF